MTMDGQRRSTFPSPFDVETPPGAQGWEEMYNWYHLYRPEQQEYDEGRFWFHDSMHSAQVLHPYDELQSECWWQALGAFNTRIFAVPPAYGVDQRILNGYLYVSPVPVTDPEEVGRRAEHFRVRAGHYYDNWSQIYEEWKAKVLDRIELMRALRFEALPALEDESVVFSHQGYSSGYELLKAYATLITTIYETHHYHFEMLNVGYVAYLNFFAFCKGAFSGITDQSIARMVGGLHVDLYRPDDELKRLAKEAIGLGLGDRIRAAADMGGLTSDLGLDEAGKEWIADWNRTSDPWFLINTDPGHPGGYHVFDTWLDDQNIPLASVKEYVQRLQAGETIDRDTAAVLAERDRITGEYQALLQAHDRPAFEEMLRLARMVFVFIEEHVLYIEHWVWAMFWRKSKELSRALAAMQAVAEPEDMFFLRRTEVSEVLYDTVVSWAVGSRGRSRSYWDPIIERRKQIYESLARWQPVPALGPPPKEVNDPFMVMLWGITTDSVSKWLNQDQDSRILQGTAGSPGTVEGPARVVTHVSELATVEQGEILVCRATSPAWAPVFSRIAATVSDVGGIMSHTAIVCREYRLPAVVGTGNAVSRIRTGQRIRVEGDSGTVTILE